MHTIDTLEPDSIFKFFTKNTSYAKLLLPLVKLLSWNEKSRRLIESLPHFQDSLTLTQFRNALVKIGFISEEIEIDASKIHNKLLPVLYKTSEGQVFLITQKNENSLEIIRDETETTETIKSDNITGKAYVFYRIDNEATEKYDDEPKSWFYSHILQYKNMFIKILLLSSIINLFLLISPLYIMNIYNKIIPAQSYNMLINFSIGAIMVICFIAIFNIIRSKMLSYISSRIDKAISEIILRTILYLPASFTENQPIGKQIARIKEFNNVKDLIASPNTVTIFEAPFTLIFIYVIYLLGGKLALIPIIMIFMLAIIYYIGIKLSENYNFEHQKLTAKKQSFLLETLTFMRDIKLLNKEKIWYDRYKELSSKAFCTEFKVSLLNSILNSISDFFMITSGVFVLIFGTIYTIENDLSIGALIAIMMLTWKSLSPIKNFFSSLPKIGQFITSVKQLNSLSKIKLETNIDSGGVANEQLMGKIEFFRVSFRYRNTLPPAILGVSFTINRGEFVCIAGASGSGKSTILKLILGLYTPQAGSILIDDTNINQLNTYELRQNIAFLPQEMHLFYGTIYQNILFADPVANKCDVEAVARMAGIYDEIMQMPQGFNTQVGDQSRTNLSANFQQKICLARAYLKNSHIMLLDEPERNLDDTSADTFFKLVKANKGHTTIIMLTHRLSHLQQADRILYFENGQLVLNDKPDVILNKIPVSKL